MITGNLVAINKDTFQASSFVFDTKKEFKVFEERNPSIASQMLLITHAEWVYLLISSSNPESFPPRPLKVIAV
jgi:hypothetical protein